MPRREIHPRPRQATDGRANHERHEPFRLYVLRRAAGRGPSWMGRKGPEHSCATPPATITQHTLRYAG